jgi:hypothetical protein
MQSRDRVLRAAIGVLRPALDMGAAPNSDESIDALIFLARQGCVEFDRDGRLILTPLGSNIVQHVGERE